LIKCASPLKRHTTGDFIQERDNVNRKLLRSPAFKIKCNFSFMTSPSFKEEHDSTHQRPVIKSFQSRFQSSMSPPTAIPFKNSKTTPTEAEFMQILIDNHHIPANPQFLIGRNMGLDYIDILDELKKRSMFNVLDIIFKHLDDDPADLVRIGCVSKDWRNIVCNDNSRNNKRLQFIKQKRKKYEFDKENISIKKRFVIVFLLDYFLFDSASFICHFNLKVRVVWKRKDWH
jgi:hypothetical protein